MNIRRGLRAALKTMRESREARRRDRPFYIEGSPEPTADDNDDADWHDTDDDTDTEEDGDQMSTTEVYELLNARIDEIRDEQRMQLRGTVWDRGIIVLLLVAVILRVYGFV